MILSKIVKEGMDLDLIKWGLCDKIIVASKMVFEKVVKLGVDPKKIFLVPYGLNQNWFKYKANPKKGSDFICWISWIKKRRALFSSSSKNSC